jgi:CBS-domain-containing membrane protein
LQGEICITKASDIMTRNIVAARASTTAREIGTKLLIGNFNGLPVVDNNIRLIGIVTAIVIFQADVNFNSAGMQGGVCEEDIDLIVRFPTCQRLISGIC